MDKNLKTYSSSQVVAWYSRLNGLLPVEEIMFEKHRAFIAKARLLDIGIGGGRTTAYLQDRCGSYTGIDYSEAFVNSVKTRFPRLKVLHADARDLSVFADSSFDAINFSFNGMDYTNLEGRTRILSEISRTLRPGGHFFFSTHNKIHHTFNLDPWLDKNLSLLVRLKTAIKLIPFFYRKIKNRKLELAGDGYAIINDAAHHYGLLTFYTSPAFLRVQLTQAGFSGIMLYNRKGESVADQETDDWIFVTCVKT